MPQKPTFNFSNWLDTEIALALNPLMQPSYQHFHMLRMNTCFGKSDTHFRTELASHNKLMMRVLMGSHWPYRLHFIFF